uniref:Portal protein n=1 Tax=viral metagenome TaxID=1070528 RepID=A0A6M3XNR8_9ZZZZ
MADNSTVETMDDDSLNELLPPEGDKDLGMKVIEILGEVLEDKAALGLREKWLRFYQLTKNKHWKQTTSKASLVSANLLHRHRTNTVNMLTANNPTFNVSKVGEPAEQEADIKDDLVHAAQHWWTDQEQQSIFSESVGNGEQYGCTIEKVAFNPELEFGIGEAETYVIDPFNFGVYPVKTGKVQKAEAVLHYWPESTRKLKRQYPEFAKDIVSDDEYLKELGDERREVQTGSSLDRGYFSTFAGVVKNVLNKVAGGKKDDDETLQVEIWVKDYTMIPDEEAIEEARNELLTIAAERQAIADDNPDPEITQLEPIDIDEELRRFKPKKPKYAGFIRCVNVCSGGKVVLWDKSNPSINPDLPTEEAQKTYLYDKFPFSWTQSITDTSNGWGMSDYEQLEGLNLELDKAISQFNLAKDKISRLKFINPVTSGVSNDELTNYPGILNPANAIEARELRYLDPPVIDPHLSKSIELYKDFFFLVGGDMMDPSQAQQGGRNVIAYKAIAALLEHANRMQKGKVENYTKMIRERGRMYLSCVMNWYEEPRWITYEDRGEELQKEVRGTKLIIPAKLTVVSGSTMPVSQIQQREEALGLYDKQAIDLEELHRRLDTPNRKDLLKRMMAGPFGELFEKLAAIGTPEQVLAAIQELSNMDMKEFEKSMKSEDMPTFQQLLQSAGAEGGGLAQPPPSPTELGEMAEKQANAEKARAEARKIDAEIAKINTDIELVKEKIVSERVEQQVKNAGMVFDEEKLKIERTKALSDVTKAIAVKKSSEERGTAPFKEKGLKSDNESSKKTD